VIAVNILHSQLLLSASYTVKICWQHSTSHPVSCPLYY